MELSEYKNIKFNTHFQIRSATRLNEYKQTNLVTDVYFFRTVANLALALTAFFS